MRFPVYPEKLRKYAHFMLRIRYILLALLVVGPTLLALGIEMEPQSIHLIYLPSQDTASPASQ